MIYRLHLNMEREVENYCNGAGKNDKSHTKALKIEQGASGE